jgi:hypothetical protein
LLGDLGLARHVTDSDMSSPLWKPLSRDAIMQPLKPQIMPSARILQLATEGNAIPTSIPQTDHSTVNHDESSLGKEHTVPDSAGPTVEPRADASPKPAGRRF